MSKQTTEGLSTTPPYNARCIYRSANLINEKNELPEAEEYHWCQAGSTVVREDKLLKVERGNATLKWDGYSKGWMVMAKGNQDIPLKIELNLFTFANPVSQFIDLTGQKDNSAFNVIVKVKMKQLSSVGDTVMLYVNNPYIESEAFEPYDAPFDSYTKFNRMGEIYHKYNREYFIQKGQVESETYSFCAAAKSEPFFHMKNLKVSLEPYDKGVMEVLITEIRVEVEELKPLLPSQYGVFDFSGGNNWENAAEAAGIQVRNFKDWANGGNAWLNPFKTWGGIKKSYAAGYPNKFGLIMYLVDGMPNARYHIQENNYGFKLRNGYYVPSGKAYMLVEAYGNTLTHLYIGYGGLEGQAHMNVDFGGEGINPYTKVGNEKPIASSGSVKNKDGFSHFGADNEYTSQGPWYTGSGIRFSTEKVSYLPNETAACYLYEVCLPNMNLQPPLDVKYVFAPTPPPPEPPKAPGLELPNTTDNFRIKRSGRWETIERVFVKQNGEWIEAERIAIKSQGEWK